MDNKRMLQDIYASRQSGKILTGELTAIEKFEKAEGELIPCAVVFYGEIKVLIPVSKMNVSREDIKVLKSMVGSTIDFIVKELDVKNKIASASREEAMNLRSKLELPKHKVGDIVLGRVTAIGLNNAKVEVFGIEVSIPKEEIAWGYVSNINEILQIGDVKPVLIQELDIEKGHLVVSMKQAKENPYFKDIDSIKKNQLYLGVVTGVEEYGIFHKIKGKEIFALTPHPNWTNYVPKVGDENLIKISRIDEDRQRINANLQRTVRKAAN